MKPIDDSKDSYLQDTPKHRSLTFHPIPDADGRPAAPPRALNFETRNDKRRDETLFYIFVFVIALLCAYKMGAGKRIASDAAPIKKSVSIKS